jgi:hypothetical protein
MMMSMMLEPQLQKGKLIFTFVVVNVVDVDVVTVGRCCSLFVWYKGSDPRKERLCVTLSSPHLLLRGDHLTLPLYKPKPQPQSGDDNSNNNKTKT